MNELRKSHLIFKHFRDFYKHYWRGKGNEHGFIWIKDEESGELVIYSMWQKDTEKLEKFLQTLVKENLGINGNYSVT